MDKKETDQYALQTVFRARTRGGFKPQLGEQRYAATAYERLVRATLEVNHPEVAHHNLYFLLSLDVGSHYPNIFDEKVIPYIARNKSTLFLRTIIISEKYVD
jgi:hypothetical protein